MLPQVLVTFMLAAAALGHPRVSRRQDGPVDPSTAADCTFYDTAESISMDCDYFADNWGIDYNQFVSYNPSVKSDCSSIKVGNSYCVEVNNGRPRATSTSSGTSGTSSPKPSPTQSGLIDSCTTFYKAVDGDTCAKVVKKYGTLTEDQFIKWNPAVGDDCAAIWAKNYYCVGIPGTPTSRPATTTATSTGTPGPSPTKSGITDKCTRYYEAQDGDSCSAVVKQFGSFDLEDFLKWNPAVGADCNGLWAKNYYCVGVPGTPTTPTATAIAQPTCANAPTPTQPGTNCECKKWHKVVKDDGCESIEKQYSISSEDFAKWNTQAGKKCGSLWLSYNVCVGV